MWFLLMIDRIFLWEWGGELPVIVVSVNLIDFMIIMIISLWINWWNTFHIEILINSELSLIRERRFLRRQVLKRLVLRDDIGLGVGFGWRVFGQFLLISSYLVVEFVVIDVIRVGSWEGGMFLLAFILFLWWEVIVVINLRFIVWLLIIIYARFFS